jgi:hypothetical protein
MAGVVWSGVARLGEVRYGETWQEGRDEARCGRTGCEHDMAGVVWSGVVRRDEDRRGVADTRNGGIEMQYEWKDGARTKGLNVQVVAGVLDRLNKKDGLVTAESVLKEARKKSSAIHNWFEWDDSVAATKHRLEQARLLVRSVVVNVERTGGEPVTIRAFVHTEGGDYQDIDFVLREPSLRALMLVKALRDLGRVRREYGDLEELAGVYAALDGVAS